VPEEVLTKYFTPSVKTQLAKTTLMSWRPEAVTLAKDYKYTPDHLLTLFHLPIKVTAKTDVSLKDDPLEDVEEHDDVREEMEYCSQVCGGLELENTLIKFNSYVLIRRQTSALDSDWQRNVDYSP